MKFEYTLLQKLKFGDQKEDEFYCLMDKRVSPNGMDVEKIRLTDPRKLDTEFEKNGCLILLTGDEIEELFKRGDLNRENLHESIYKLAVAEGVITKR